MSNKSGRINGHESRRRVGKLEICKYQKRITADVSAVLNMYTLTEFPRLVPEHTIAPGRHNNNNIISNNNNNYYRQYCRK